MLIDCPSCARSYSVSHDDVGPHGRTVICPRCDAQWDIDGDGFPSTRTSIADLSAVAVSRRSGYAETAPRLRPGRDVLGSLAPAVGCVACVALAMLLIGAREHVARYAPRTAQLYAALGMPVNVRGLDFAEVVTARSAETDDVIVSGTIRNVAQQRVAVPRLTYVVRNAVGLEIASWTEKGPAKTLAAGHALPFVSSPHELPADGRSVVVHFELDDEATQPFRVAGGRD